MGVTGINPETDRLEQLELFLIANDKGDLYLLPWKHSHSPQQYEQEVRRRVKEYLAGVARRPEASV
jgi:hypothetical protein